MMSPAQAVQLATELAKLAMLLKGHSDPVGEAKRLRRAYEARGAAEVVWRYELDKRKVRR